MLTDSERFAFVPYRIHVFETSGNAYDAVQVDEAIKTGDLLLILDEGIVGVAMTWPFAVTANSGNLHRVNPKPGETLDQLAKSLGVEPAAVQRAVRLARQLKFDIDAVITLFIDQESAISHEER